MVVPDDRRADPRPRHPHPQRVEETLQHRRGERPGAVPVPVRVLHEQDPHPPARRGRVPGRPPRRRDRGRGPVEADDEVPGPLGRRAAHHDDGARGVAGGVQARRAQLETAQDAAAQAVVRAGTGDQEVGAARGGQQRRARVVVHEADPHLAADPVAHQVPGPGQLLAGRGVELVQDLAAVADRPGVHDGRRLHPAHDVQVRARAVRGVRGPLHGGAAVLQGVQTDDDRAHPSHLRVAALTVERVPTVRPPPPGGHPQGRSRGA